MSATLSHLSWGWVWAVSDSGFCAPLSLCGWALSIDLDVAGILVSGWIHKYGIHRGWGWTVVERREIRLAFWRSGEWTPGAETRMFLYMGTFQGGDTQWPVSVWHICLPFCPGPSFGDSAPGRPDSYFHECFIHSGHPVNICCWDDASVGLEQKEQRERTQWNKGCAQDWRGWVLRAKAQLSVN